VIDAEGSFLGPGRANRHLLKCLVEWAPCRIEPYGLDLSPALAKLARRRVPHWADRIFVGNALTWEPPMRLDVVRTELVYVPDDLRQAYLERLLARVGAPAKRELRPVLDVTEKDRAAIRLYERRGWQRVHSEPWHVAADTLLHYYVGPPETSPRAATPAA